MVDKAYLPGSSIYLLVETRPPLSQSVLARSLSQISTIYSARFEDNERKRGKRTSRATVQDKVFPISRLTEMIRSGCNAFMVPYLTVPCPSRFHPALHDPLDVLRRPKDSVLCNRAPCSRVKLCSTNRHPRFVDHRT